MGVRVPGGTPGVPNAGSGVRRAGWCCVIVVDASGRPVRGLAVAAAHAFTVDGLACASLAGLLQSLLFVDADDQADVRALSGPKATKAGRRAPDWTATQTLHWAGRPVDRHGPDYQLLLDVTGDVE